MRSWSRAAILVVATAYQQPDHTDPRHDVLIALTIGELRRLVTITAPTQPTQPTPSTGRYGDDVTKPPPDAATTNDATPPPAHRSQMPLQFLQT